MFSDIVPWRSLADRRSAEMHRIATQKSPGLDFSIQILY
jgi:hypothetical protein